MSLRTSREGFEGLGLQAKPRPAGFRRISFLLSFSCCVGEIIRAPLLMIHSPEAWYRPADKAIPSAAPASHVANTTC